MRDRRWRAAEAVAACPMMPVKQGVWRGHRNRYDGLDHGGTLVASGRFHRAPPDFPARRCWPALYTAFDLAVALGEIERNTKGKRWHEYVFSEIWVQLEAVADCRDAAHLGITVDALLDDADVSLPQALAEAVVDVGAEGLVAPSATRLGDNLIVFPHLMRTGSTLIELRTVTPRLVKDGLG